MIGALLEMSVQIKATVQSLLKVSFDAVVHMDPDMVIVGPAAQLAVYSWLRIPRYMGVASWN